MRVLWFQHSDVAADSVLPRCEAASIPNERNPDIFFVWCLWIRAS